MCAYHRVACYVFMAWIVALATAIPACAQGARQVEALNDQVTQLYSQGRYAEAMPLAKRAVQLAEQGLRRGDSHALASLNNLAMLHQAQGELSEAEPLLRRALEVSERALGPDDLVTLASLNNLASLYQGQGRYSEAEPMLKRVFETSRRVRGERDRVTVVSESNLGSLFFEQDRYAEAEPHIKHSFDIGKIVFEPHDPDALLNMNNLAALYEVQQRYREAEALYMQLMGRQQTALGRNHPDTLRTVNNFAVLLKQRGAYELAQILFTGLVEAYLQSAGAEHPDTLRAMNNLAGLYFVQGKWADASVYWLGSTEGLVNRTRRGAGDVGGPRGRRKTDAERLSWQFWELVKAAYRLVHEGRVPNATALPDMFETAQWVNASEAAQSLAQMASRGAKGDPALAALVRERQDALAAWQSLEARRSAILAQEPGQRPAKAEAESAARLKAFDGRIAEIDARLAADFPDYYALASPNALSVADVQAQLRDDEALILFLDTPAAAPTPEETFIWAITRTQARWVRSALGRSGLEREVAALRCGLDYTAWDGPRCKELTGAVYAQPLPFDHARAYRLYQALFGEVQDLIKDKKHLLLVPSGALTQLPFQMLVTAPPANKDHRSAAWLIRDRALSVLPAVSSLKALRSTSRPSAAAKPMIGFGNPLLDGPDDRYAKRAKLSVEKQSCPNSPWQQIKAVLGLRAGVTPIETRGDLADLSRIRALAPLPETADELCAVARDMGADTSKMYLGAKATERELKAISARGELAQYRVVHFATHGTIAGELKGSIEPGLILTPPNEASAEDDGYLSASEVAGLKLDADWVILSACNTAAGNAPSAEALSGLARAFVYAQTRALLVSHWEVYSDATVKLITASMREMTGDKSVGRAEALRRAMLALIDKGTPDEVHPAYWAPFIVVGEGAR